MEIKGTLITVKVGQILPNKWNPNQQSKFIFEKEKKSIRDHGFIDPCTAREIKPGMYELIDGEHRWRAAKEIGLKEVTLNNLGKVPKVIAQQLTLILNDTRGEAQQDKLSDLLSSIKLEIGLDQMVANLPYQEMQISSLLASSSIDWSKVGSEPIRPPGETDASVNLKLFAFKLTPAGHKALVDLVAKLKLRLGPKDPKKVTDDSVVRHILKALDVKIRPKKK